MKTIQITEAINRFDHIKRRLELVSGEDGKVDIKKVRAMLGDQIAMLEEDLKRNKAQGWFSRLMRRFSSSDII